MSNYTAVKSSGAPYFGFEAPVDLAAADLPGQGLFSLAVEFAIHRLPTRLASDDECHPLIAFGDYLKAPPEGNVLALGVSPSGRLVWTTQVNTLMSAAGTVGATGEWHSAMGTYDRFLPDTDIVFDGFVVGGGAPGMSQPAQPTRLGRVYLFNGTNAISNFSASIRFAQLVWTITGGDNPTVTYAIDEGHGSTINAVLSSTDGAPGGGFWVLHPASAAANWALSGGEWVAPASQSLPWGAIPTSSAVSAFGWGPITSFTKRSMPTTAYRKVATP